MVPSILRTSDPASITSSGEGSQSTILDTSNKPVEQSEQSIDHLQFSIPYWWKFEPILFLKYLFIDTYKATSRHLGLQSVSLDHRLVLFVSHKYRLEFNNSWPARIPTWISVTFHYLQRICSTFFSSILSPLSILPRGLTGKSLHLACVHWS